VPAFDHWLSTLPDILKLDPFEDARKSMILYTYEDVEFLNIYRFSGFWHEPGAFAVLSFYSLYFSTLLCRGLSNKYSILTIIAILATISTTAYLALAVFLFGYTVFISKLRGISKTVLAVGIVIGFSFAYTGLDFLSEKMEEQKSFADEQQLSGTATNGRFLALYKSLNVMRKYPILGRGLAFKSKADITSAEHTGYGWYSFIASIGLVFGGFFLWNLYRGIRKYTFIYQGSWRYAVLGFVVFMIMLFSQPHISSPLFFIFFLFPIMQPKQSI
jgi:hypothetical protein